MKKLLSLIITVTTVYGCQEDILTETQEDFPATHTTTVCSSDYYWCDGVKIPLTINEDKMYVLVEASKLADIRKSAINTRAGWKSTGTNEIYATLGIRSLVEPSMQRSLMSLTLDRSEQKSIDPKDVVYAAPYYRTNEGAEIGITNVFSVQLTGHQDLVKIQKIAKDYKLELLGNNEFDPSIYYLSCTKESKGNALEMANLMYESGAFAYATPEFIVESIPTADPNDTYFNRQWNLKNTSSSKIDIKYVHAMSAYTFPHIDDIIVAVVDNGVYNNHEDLPLHNISYNAHTGKSPSGLYGDHGTKVAGVIGATSNNGKGIAGVASGVKIMPVSICYTKDADRLGISASTTTDFANAIRFAANNGARVINNSWSFNTTSPISEINNAITYAHGKGCIVVFASGNDSGAVSQPAAGAPSATLVVGAIEQDGYRAPYSNYGSSLDVIAPGTEIWTTTWTGGYDYVDGTSFAAPHVSGIVALIWARDPDLQAWRVRNIIEQSARKVGSNAYETTPERLNGLWNKFAGYGLVDAYAAVSAVSGTAPSAASIGTSLSVVEPGNLSLMGLGYEAWNIAYLARGSGHATCYIEDYDPSVTYLWSSTLPPYTGEGSEFTVNFASDGDEPVLHNIECRAEKNGLSTTSGIHLAVIPQRYSY